MYKISNTYMIFSTTFQPLWDQERKELLELKEEECKSQGRDFNGKLDYWDMRYYCNMIEEKKYSVDQEKLKEYFPMQKVTEGLLEIYQQLLGLKFELVKDADVWHEDVTMVSLQCFGYLISFLSSFTVFLFRLFGSFSLGLV